MIELECCELITLAIEPGLKADSWLTWVEPQGVNNNAVSMTSLETVGTGCCPSQDELPLSPHPPSLLPLPPLRTYEIK